MTFWSEFVVGETEELGSHRFEPADIKRFAARFDPQIFHLDEDRAKASVLGGLCASGWHTAAVFMRLNVEARQRQVATFVEAGNPPPRIGPSPGFKNLKWPKPVYAGDTIAYRQTVTGKRKSESRPGWGVIEFDTVGVNQKGETVFSFDGAVFCGTD